MPYTLAPSFPAHPHGAQDSHLHALAQAHRAQVAILEQRFSTEQARQQLARFPMDLIAQACRDLTQTGLTPSAAHISQQADQRPHLALALIEKQLPAYLNKLSLIESQARQSRESLQSLREQCFHPTRPMPSMGGKPR